MPYSFSSHSQRGAGITSIMLGLIGLGILAKLGIAVIPAHVGDHQFTKLVAKELKEANQANMTEKQFFKALYDQMKINANYSGKPEDMLIITNKTPGSLAVRSQYEVENVLYQNTVIVNRFERDITAADAE